MKTPKAARGPETGNGEVDAFTAKLAQPLKADIEAARKVILGANPAIGEEIKWNAPGFRTTESFATVNLRSVDKLHFIFHLGVKVRKDWPELKIPAPTGMVKWLAKGRCLVTAGTGRELTANKTDLQNLVRAWIRFV